MELLELGKKTAFSLRASGSCRGRKAVKEIRRAVEIAEKTRQDFACRDWGRIPAAAEWLMDNVWIAKREGKTAEEELRRGSFRTAEGRVYLLALAAAVVHAAPGMEQEDLEQYLAGLQQGNALTERELSLFVPALKGALCIRLAELCPSLRAEPDRDDLASELKQIFTGFRTLSSANLGPLLERSSPVEQILQNDPVGAYSAMDEETRACYRHQVCLLAKRRGLSERETAFRALELALNGQGEERHIGWFLFVHPLGAQKKKPTGVLYVGCILLPTLFVALWLGFLLESLILVLLLLLPISDLVKNLVDFIVVRTTPPRPVHRMDLTGGIPAEGRTLCVIAGLLTGEKSGDEYAALLEKYRLANRDSGGELRFGLLADLPDRDAPMGDDQRQWVWRAQEAIKSLNEKYGGGFYLFFREPVFQENDERYVGWERKRGALLELARFLRGRPSGIRVKAGDVRALKGTQYIITLDSDTSLNVGAARELIGAMLHPLNRPVVDPGRRVVVRGYGLLQPRIGVDLRAANRSQFSRIFAGVGGIDPYGGACSDVYHDLFDRGSYTGKGIFHIDTFLTCLDGRLPQNRILSHDLLEGAYLHAGLLETVELTDGYPYKVSSYFSRLHRWVRGDWQLLPWLGRRVKDESGKWEKNPITSVDRWKLFDNLRRSLSPISTLVALLLGMCLSVPAFGTAAALAIVSAWSNLLLTGADLAVRGGVGLHRRYHATIIAGFGGMILQTLVQLLFLPWHAWVCASAVCAALWRSLISKKKLLEWVTAAATEGKNGTLWSGIRSQWPTVAVGGFAMIFSRFPAGAAVGLVWTVAPVFAYALSQTVKEMGGAAEEDRPFLLHQANLIWGYFRDWLREEDHWLPPDNVQEKPWLGPARRTSPTNIGMALLSCVSAADLELIGREQAIELITHILDTVEILPKWKGHLYNWYDTEHCTPLYPRYVSTVDSGNLRGSLIALRESLYQWGEGGLARRAEALSDAMDLAPLYDRERRLFTIGFDVEKGELTEGWYDLMASEARLTSYLAVALGEVDPRHWRKLGRGLVGDNNYCGMASWTGTMFEYFMPNLLLPCEEGSLMYESLSFCVYAQKRRGNQTKTPWGISESGFYAFDPGMAYQYKANGVQTLGLKRGLDKELVVAPYASFLALLLAPRSAGRNLRRLRDMGLEGSYGLYEAVDFTPSRLQMGEEWAAVRSFMVHHLGMSLIAIDNVLNGNIMQKRFLKDCSIGAFRELLQEKVPVGAPVMKPDRQLPMDRPRPFRQSQFCREGVGYDLAHPACQLLSNGLISALCTDAGGIRLMDDRGETPLLTCFGERYLPEGVSFFYRSVTGDLFPLTAAPLYEDGEYTWKSTGGTMQWTCKKNGCTAEVCFSLPRGLRGGLWTVALDRPEIGELICYLEPVLNREADYMAHPAYSKLSLQSRGWERGVTFLRRPKDGDRQAALAILWDGTGSVWSTSRETALGRGGLRNLANALAQPFESKIDGAVLDPCLLIRIPIREGKRFQFHLALGTEDGEEDALRTAKCIMAHPEQEAGNPDGLLRHLQLSVTEGIRAMELLSCLAFPTKGERHFPQSSLWAHSVSGDLPIGLVLPIQKEETRDTFPFCAHALLRQQGFSFDLVCLLSDGGNYLSPQKDALLEQLKALGMESEVGRRGGIHLVECAKEEDTSLWLDWAAVIMDVSGHWSDSRESLPVKPPNLLHKGGKGFWEWRYDEEGNFVLEMDGALPPVGWSHLLVSEDFGWITDETGCGHLWQKNSRENQITEWNNDPLAVGGPEWFLLELKDLRRSIFTDLDGCPVRVTYGFGWARWEKEWNGETLRTTGFVPWGTRGRLLRIEEPPEGGILHYFDKKQGETLYKIEKSCTLFTDENGTFEVDSGGFAAGLKATEEKWKNMCCRLTVETPDEELNHYLNGWCLYQVIACRLLGRTSRYQNGGAYGFRDQLQDTLALLPFDGTWTRDQILRCCRHQFPEGDVQHWWHEVEGEEDRGVRTRISDDLLWLPYALARYLETWGDWEFLAVQVNYLSGEPLKEGEGERYEVPGNTSFSEDVYTHACRAIRLVLERGTGEHGLLKMGAGDWNDGMNRVGVRGRGESVWLTWFGITVLDGFGPIARHQGDGETVRLCEEWGERLRQAAREAWDGEWYLRGWYDDGSPLGSAQSQECQIDSIAQSWAVLAGERDGRAKTALRSALDRLFDRKAGIVKLFDPPFDDGPAKPGYIKGYLPGVRENGGQYTHAAVWLALACFGMEKTEEGYEIMKALLPQNHPTEVYKAEPYVLAGDVYSNPAHLGRGGWSWYTGAAGWFYQTAVGGLLGLKVKDGRLFVDPALPKAWPGWSARWETDGGSLAIQVRRGKEKAVRLDGAPVESIGLSDLRGEHRLEVTTAEEGE